MKLKQISIFLENSPGRLYQATKALGDAGINLRALTLAEASDFGVLRLLVSDVIKARRIMMEKQFPARVDDVVAVEIDDRSGSLAQILLPLNEANVSVKYMYAFTGFNSSRAVMIFRFNDNDQAIGILQGLGVKLLDSHTFGMLENA